MTKWRNTTWRKRHDINEDYAYEHLRQKRIDAMTDDEFIKLMDLPKMHLDDDLDDEALKELEVQHVG